jgi:hypothetical protein
MTEEQASTAVSEPKQAATAASGHRSAAELSVGLLRVASIGEKTKEVVMRRFVAPVDPGVTSILAGWKPTPTSRVASSTALG